MTVAATRGADDLAELASAWAATDAVVADDDDAAGLESAGVRVHRVDG